MQGRPWTTPTPNGSTPYPRPTIPLKEYAYQEMRYRVLLNSNPVEAEELMKLAQETVNLRWKAYEEMAVKKASDFVPVA